MIDAFLCTGIGVKLGSCESSIRLTGSNIIDGNDLQWVTPDAISCVSMPEPLSDDLTNIISA